MANDLENWWTVDLDKNQENDYKNRQIEYMARLKELNKQLIELGNEKWSPEI